MNVDAFQAGAPAGKSLLKETEAQSIREVLEKHGGHRTKASMALGVHPTTLWRKMKKLGIK